jgi:DNA-3-methyladenine glycosylase
MPARRFLAFGGDPVTTARRLLGQELVHVVGGQRLAGRIVEVEAYLGPADRAAHTFGWRRTRRNASMWAGGGHAYVYFTYGMHHCLNVVCGDVGSGTAVLLRALEPSEGMDEMFARRSAARRPSELCSGPGRLTQALGIDLARDGCDLRSDSRLWIEERTSRPLRDTRVLATARIGVGYAGSWARRRLRFLIRGNPCVSAQRALARVGASRTRVLRGRADPALVRDAARGSSERTR